MSSLSHEIPSTCLATPKGGKGKNSFFAHPSIRMHEPSMSIMREKEKNIKNILRLNMTWGMLIVIRKSKAISNFYYFY